MTQHQIVAVGDNLVGCSVCRAIGDGLPVECPGYAMSLVAQHAVARGHAQFVSGKWFVAVDPDVLGQRTGAGSGAQRPVRVRTRDVITQEKSMEQDQKYLRQTFPKFPVFVIEQLADVLARAHQTLDALHIMRETQNRELAERDKVIAEKSAQLTEMALQHEKKLTELSTIHANVCQENHRLQEKLNRSRFLNAKIQESNGDWINDPCPECKGSGKSGIGDGYCCSCGGSGHVWMSWEDQYKRLKSFVLQKGVTINFELPDEDHLAPGGTHHYRGCPRRTDEFLSCRCALVGQQSPKEG